MSSASPPEAATETYPRLQPHAAHSITGTGGRLHYERNIAAVETQLLGKSETLCYERAGLSKELAGSRDDEARFSVFETWLLRGNSRSPGEESLSMVSLQLVFASPEVATIDHEVDYLMGVKDSHRTVETLRCPTKQGSKSRFIVRGVFVGLDSHSDDIVILERRFELTSQGWLEQPVFGTEKPMQDDPGDLDQKKSQFDSK